MEEITGLEQHIKEALETELPLEHKLFKGEEIEGVYVGRVEFRFVRFENCRILSCDFMKAYFEQVEFYNCDCSNSDFSESYWRESGIVGTKGQGAKFTDAVFRNTKIRESKLDYANFGQAFMENLVVEDCSFVSAFLSELKLKRTVFVRNKFESTDFYKTSLKGMDLSTCELEGPLLSDDFREIKGAKLSPEQAVNVAKMLGIVVV